jgi:hypothetical protein
MFVALILCASVAALAPAPALTYVGVRESKRGDQGCCNVVGLRPTPQFLVGVGGFAVNTNHIMLCYA